MLKIGEFSSLSQTSITTLRHYDELGLLKPVHVDAATGYRYYSVSQLPRLHRILALKDLGFPLERVAGALDEGVNADALKGMLLLRRIEQEQHVRERCSPWQFRPMSCPGKGSPDGRCNAFSAATTFAMSMSSFRNLDSWQA